MSNVIPSDNLLQLCELFLKWQPLFSLLEVRPQLRLVLDTNAVIEELLFLVKSRKNPSARTNLQEAIDSGLVVALAPFKLRDEVIKHIPRLAKERGIPEQSLREAWLEYQKRINFVEVGLASDEEAVAAVDRDDLPFVHLCQKVNADAVVSRDRHIRAMGARSIELNELVHARDYAREKAPEVMLRVGTFIVTIPAIAGVHGLVKLLGMAGKSIRKLSPGGQLALLAGVLAVSAHRRSRKAISSFISDGASKLKVPSREILNVLGDIFDKWGAAEERVGSKQELLDRSIPRAEKMPLRLMARSVCLEAGHPLTIEQLTRRVLLAGYESRSAQLKNYLLRVLRQSEQFEYTADGRWAVRSAD